MSIRTVTDDEAGAYREQGWAHLPGLVTLDVVDKLRRRLEVRQAARNEEIERLRSGAQGEQLARLTRQIESYLRLSEDEELFRRVALSPNLGDDARRLTRGGKPVRLFQDIGYVKAARTGEPTEAYQDFPTYALDRGGAVQFWIALGDITPEMGPLRFLTGSHRFGSLGFSFLEPGDELTNQHPWLKQLEKSPPVSLAAGDATVHDVCTVHFADANRTDRPRMGYACRYIPADTRYTGQPHYETDGIGLAVGQLLDHPKFPLVGSSR